MCWFTLEEIGVNIKTRFGQDIIKGMRIMGQRRYDEVVRKTGEEKLAEVRKEQEKMADKIKENEKLNK